jgi:hypothetical protein
MITPLDALFGLGLYFAGVFIFGLIWRGRERRNKRITPADNYDFRAQQYRPVAGSRS